MTESGISHHITSHRFRLEWVDLLPVSHLTVDRISWVISTVCREKGENGIYSFWVAAADVFRLLHSYGFKYFISMQREFLGRQIKRTSLRDDAISKTSPLLVIAGSECCLLGTGISKREEKRRSLANLSSVICLVFVSSESLSNCCCYCS